MRPVKPLILTIGLGVLFLPGRFAGQDRLVVQNNRTKSATVNFIRFRSPMIALEHVRVIDGTGAPVMLDQTILISDGKIAAMGKAGAIRIPGCAQRLDFTGYSVIPGLVGMHDHLFYSLNYFGSHGVRAYDMPFSFPRLYLAAGVTTIRTTGSFEPYTDLEIKRTIEARTMIGPKMNVTGPYLEGAPFPLIQIHKLTGPEDARRTVDYWADEGAESFKVYADITRAELEAAISAAHKRGLTVTGHLCSIGFREAAEMGIDGLEHGLWVDTEFAANKQPDMCPDPGNATAADLEVKSEPIQETIRTLVDHHVAITSTLPVWEEFIPGPQAPERVLRALSTGARKAYLAERARLTRESEDPHGSSFVKIRRYTAMFRKEMEFERAFVQAGGLLMAGPDGVLGSDIAGFGDQRELELLVQSGFTPLEAIKIATWNGAQFLKKSDGIGSLEAGKQADIVLVRGDPSTNIRDIEHVDLVFKDGVAYDSKKLIDSVTGQVGIR
jgi:imidazolonepropionase-like amidohydrolase